MRFWIRRPSPAMIVACASLFVALSGAGTAAVLITSKNIKDNTIQSRDIKNNQVTGADVNEASLGSVAAANTVGGLTATAMLTKVTVRGNSVSMCPSGGGVCSVGSSLAICPPGLFAIAGGWDGESAPPVDATVGYNKTYGSSWGVIMANNALISSTYHAFAVCAPSSTGLAGARSVSRAAVQEAFASDEAAMRQIVEEA